MKKEKFICLVSSIVGILMISTGLILTDTNSIDNLSVEEFNIKNLATSTNASITSKDKNINIDDNKYSSILLSDINMNAASSGVYRVEVFDGLTMDELAAKLNRVLGGSMSGKGYLIASKSLEFGVDPYVAVAIMMHETGNGTSHISQACYNFGGQKGSGCGSYQAFGSVDEGLVGMISNLYRNYYARGLTTVESIGPRYAESGTWVSKINGYVSRIRNA